MVKAMPTTGPTTRNSLLFLGAIMLRTLAAAQSPQSPESFFKGKLLVVACDTDMLPSAYLGGPLGPNVGPDQLAVIRLDQPLSGARAATVPVSNSVTGPPASVATTPDGRYAIVIETRGARSASATKLSDLPPGHAVTVIDLAEQDHPRVVQKFEGYENPLSISINYDGSLVAVAYAATDKQIVPPLALYRFDRGRLSKPFAPPVPGFTQGQKLTSAKFHPLQNTLALVYETPAKLAFVRLADQDSALALSSMGNDVQVDQSSFTAVFTPDGRFVLVNAMLPFVRGTVSSIRVGAPHGPADNADGQPHNFLVSRVQAGIFPEGLAVSPNGQWAVTSNLENSTFPLDDARQGFFSSLTLIRLEPTTGILTRVGDYPFDGMLPEAPIFDDSSRFIAVTNYSQFRNAKGGGSIDFWRLAKDAFDPGRAELVKMVESIPVPRGPQSISIVRTK